MLFLNFSRPHAINWTFNRFFICLVAQSDIKCFFTPSLSSKGTDTVIGAILHSIFAFDTTNVMGQNVCRYGNAKKIWMRKHCGSAEWKKNALQAS